MAFKTLADRFEERSKDIYTKFNARKEPESQPYISILPDSNDSRSRIKNDSRALPVVSTIRDTQRVSKFLRSSDGLLFLAQQTLLQTGNTFVSTKLYNPISPILNTVPFIHARRFIPTQVQNINPSGLLQNTTVETISSRIAISGEAQALQSITRKTLLPTINSLASKYLSSQLRGVAKSILPIPQEYYGSRPEYATFGYKNGALTATAQGPMILDPQPLNQRGLQRLNYTATIKSQLIGKATNLAVGALNRLIPRNSPLRSLVSIPEPYIPTAIPSFIQAAEDFRNRQQFRNNQRVLTSKYFAEGGPPVDNGVAVPLTSNTNSVNAIKPILTKKTRDLYNIPYVTYNDDPNKINYANINGDREDKSDIIKFIFRDVDGNNPVHFRALLSTIKESIKTEFNEQRYVGRTERFVTYGGAKRGLTLSFNIAAFSQDEAEGMWSRVNYLSGLAFPKDVQNGFMVPPLFKLTIGELYDNQPCYIESLDYDFLDETITFDIDKEVPFAINVQMQLSILEKRSKFYNSPFYKITEKIAEDQTKEQQRLRNIKLPGAEAAAKELVPQFTPVGSPLSQTTPFTPRIIEPRISSIPSRL